jgi:Ca-activated chloride channel family protein
MIAWRDGMALGALVLVPAVALFLAWALRERERALATFVEAALLPTVVPDLDRRRRRLRAGLVVAAVAAIAVALGGPMWGFHWEEVRREGIDLVVALDTSKSMLATDVAPNRLARAKLAVEDLLAELKGDRIGLVAFAGSAFVECPLTLDRNAFRESLQAVEVGLIPRGGTNLTIALATGLDAFEGHQGSHQALVLITDGEDHEGSLDDAIKQATERGVKVFTVGIGTAEGELIPAEGGGFLKDRKGQVVKSRLGEETLKKIALDTGGVYLHAAGTDLGLAGLYRDHIATMEKRELASTLERRYEHRYQIPLGLAALLLLVEAFLGDRRLEPRRWRRRRAAPEGVPS